MTPLKVPIVGTNVVAEGEGVSPAVNGATLPPVQPTQAPAQTQQPAQRQSLHNVRMTPQQAPVEVRGEFDKFGNLKWRPVEKTQEQEQADTVADVDDSSPDAGGGALDGGVDVPPLTTQTHATAGESVHVNELQRQIADLKDTVNLLAQVQLKGALPQPTKPQAPSPPDPTQFDFYEPAQVAEFHKLNNAYIQATVRHEVNTALEPHGVALQDAELNRQYNDLVYRHGQDANFKDRMGAALQLMAKIPGVPMSQAFDAVGGFLPASSPQQQSAATTSQPVAKPAQRTITAQEAAQKAEQARKLPASNGVSGTAEQGLPDSLRNVGALGRIMFHNRQNGRAQPIGN